MDAHVNDNRQHIEGSIKEHIQETVREAETSTSRMRKLKSSRMMTKDGRNSLKRLKHGSWRTTWP